MPSTRSSDGGNGTEIIVHEYDPKEEKDIRVGIGRARRDYFLPVNLAIPSILLALHVIPRNQVTTTSGTHISTTTANPKKAGPGPTAAIMVSINATPTAPKPHRTRLLMAVLLAPHPGHKSETSVWFRAKMALLVAAIKNCNVSGTTIQPRRAVTVGDASEKPYAAVATTKSAAIHGRLRRRACSIGNLGGRFFAGSM